MKYPLVMIAVSAALLAGVAVCAEPGATSPPFSKKTATEQQQQQAPILIKSGSFHRNGKPVYFTGPFLSWHNPVKWADRRGPWSQNRAYCDGMDREMLKEFGFNTWHPICFMSYFIMKKYYPQMLKKKWARYGTRDYFRDCEKLARNLISRMGSTPIMLEFSDIVALESRMKGIVAPGVIQNNPWSYHFFPFEPATPRGFELYATMFRDGTRFVLENNGDPFLYELFNEPNYNGFCRENFSAWQEWLKRKYNGDIAAANQAWGTSYKTFAEPVAALPKKLDHNPGPWVDWMHFISSRLAGYIRQWAGVIREVDTRKKPVYFTWQPAHAVSSFNYRNAFNMTFCDFLDVMGTEYCTPRFGVDPGNMKSDNINEVGFTAGNDTKFMAAKLVKAYARGRPIVDFEMHSARYANGIRIPSHSTDIETNLWFQVINGFAGSIMYAWSGRNWEWRTMAEAKQSVLSAHYKHHCLLNPYNYSENALMGLRRFREQVDRLAEIVLPRPRVRGVVGVLYLDHQSWLLKGIETRGYTSWQTGLRLQHVPHDFIVAEYLRHANDLAGYKAVFCPSIKFCAPRLKQILRDYVAAGGVLVAGPEAFSRTEYGRPANAADILGVKVSLLNKAGRFIDTVIGHDNAELGSYRAICAGAMPAATAGVFATWKKTGRPAVYANAISRGMVYTLLFDCGKQTLRGIFAHILRTHKVKNRNDLLLPESEAVDTASTLDTIDRGNLRLHFIVNWSPVGHLSRLVMRDLAANDGWHVYDAITRKAFVPKTERETWTARELADGFKLFLPTQERVLVLVSQRPMPWARGRLTLQTIMEQARQQVKRDKAELARLARDSIANQKKIEERRTWTEVDPGNTFYIDLRKHANMGFRDEKTGDRKGGWTDQGPLNDMRDLPTGRQIFYGVPYDIIEPEKNNGKSAVILRGGDRQYFPAAATGIKVNRKAVALFFLHATAWTSGRPLFHYVVHYQDGSQVEIPIFANRESAEWWNPADTNLKSRDLRVAWSIKNRSHLVGLFTYKWKNPNPDKIIATLDIVSHGKALPMVVAITGLTRESEEYDPITGSVELLGKRLRDNWYAKSWNAASATMQPGADGWMVFTAQPRVGSWGGLRLTAKKQQNGKLIKLGTGEWELCYEINYAGRDPFGKIDAEAYLQVSVYVNPEKDRNGKYRLKRNPMQRRVDKNPETWEKRTILLGRGPLSVWSVAWQYIAKNPPHGVKLRRVYFQRKP